MYAATNCNSDEFTQPRRLGFPLSRRDRTEDENLSLVSSTASGVNSFKLHEMNDSGSARNYKILLERYGRSQGASVTITEFLQKKIGPSTICSDL
eukprot:scaffold30270_cov76-Amphora_coffeaeformis.AAC.1